MYVFPPAILPVPDPGFLKLLDEWRPIGGQTLIKPNVGDDRYVSHELYLRRTHGCVLLPLHSAQLEIEMMKLQTFYQLPLSFRFKSR
jgi:hypothetical protein